MSPVRRRHLVISMGDPNGIGPELILRCVKRLADRPSLTIVLTGHPAVFQFYASSLNLDIPNIREVEAWSEARPGWVNILRSDAFDANFTPRPGELDERAGHLAMEAVTMAVDECMSGRADGMVTAPFSKEAVQLAGFRIPGHTEYIAERTGGDEPVMMMIADDLRIGVVTAHVSLRSVADSITGDVILKKLEVIHRMLRSDFGIDEPQIAVLGLNPHAGDGGLMGQEELDIIGPAVTSFNKGGSTAIGPLPADAFFGLRKDKQFDAVLCMYHDQGLVPFKALAFDRGVNFTGGLPIVRTSPVHGTAFDIAGKGRARLGSMLAAIDLASEVVDRRRAQTDENATTTRT